MAIMALRVTGSTSSTDVTTALTSATAIPAKSQAALLCNGYICMYLQFLYCWGGFRGSCWLVDTDWGFLALFQDRAA